MALEVLAERWTLLVVRELLCGSRRFNDLSRGVPLMSRTLLSQRLKTLEDSGVVVKTPSTAGGHEYVLTRAGEELRPLVMGLGEWGKRWASSDLSDEHLDGSLLMWDIHRRIDHDKVPGGRIVVRFEFNDVRSSQRRYWLKLERGEADVCLTDPGFDVQLVVDTTLRALTDVWQGHLSFTRACRTKALRLSGKPALRRDFPGWLRLSAFADVEMPNQG